MSSSKVKILSPQVDSIPRQLTPGISAGDFQVAVLSEIKRILKEARGNQLKAIELGIKRMRTNGLIEEAEMGHLLKIITLIISAAKGRTEPNKAQSEVRKIYFEMLGNEESSHNALAIASLANNSFASKPNTGSTIGGFIGALAGATFGGTGFLVGAFIGGAVGGAIGECLGAEEAD